MSTEDSIQKLECLKENLEKSLAMIVHGSPKLKKKIEEVTKRIEELMALEVEGVDTHKEGPYQCFTDIGVLEEFYSN